jgi:hypothetical protein
MHQLSQCFHAARGRPNDDDVALTSSHEDWPGVGDSALPNLAGKSCAPRQAEDESASAIVVLDARLFFGDRELLIPAEKLIGRAGVVLRE